MKLNDAEIQVLRTITPTLNFIYRGDDAFLYVTENSPAHVADRWITNGWTVGLYALKQDLFQCINFESHEAFQIKKLLLENLLDSERKTLAKWIEQGYAFLVREDDGLLKLFNGMESPKKTKYGWTTKNMYSPMPRVVNESEGYLPFVTNTDEPFDMRELIK